MRAGEALADALVAYFRSRAGSLGKSVRLLVVDFPAHVQETAARALVRDAAIVGEGRLAFSFDGTWLELNIGFIQSADDARRCLLAEGEFEFGTSPDFPVSLRNQRGDVLLFCPPELFEACHESIKSNTFQRFESNRKFGTQRSVLERLRVGNGFASDAEKLSYIVDEKLREDHNASGEIEWARSWISAEETLSQPVLDLRTLGLLPSEGLALSRSAGELRQAVRANLAFQRDLVEGLAQGQRRYLERAFGQREGSAELVDYLTRFAFRLTHDDLRWRLEWPIDLLIDHLRRTRRPPRATSVTSLEAVGARTVNGLQVVAGADVELRWSFRGGQSELDVDVLIDGQVVENVRLADRQVSLTLPSRQVHRIELRGVTATLQGRTTVLVVFPPQDGLLVLSVGGGTPGGRLYDVVRNEPFQIRWWVIPQLPAPESVDVYLVSGGADPEGDDRLETIRDGRLWLEVRDGIENAADILVQARLTTGETFESQIRVDVRDPDRSPKAAGSIAKAVAQLASRPEVRRDASQAAIPRRVRVASTPDGFDVLLEGEDGAPSGRFGLVRSELLDQAEAQVLGEPRVAWPRTAQAARAGRTTRWEVTSLDSEFLPSVPPDFVDLHDAFLEKREAVFKRLEESGGVNRAELSHHTDHVQEYADSYCDLLEGLARDGRTVDRYASLMAMTDALLVMNSGNQPRAILLSPTHPLRLAWLTQFERWVREMVESGDPWAPLPVATLDSAKFPTHLVDWNRRHFRGAATAADGNWLVLIPENEAEIDRVIPAELSRVLSLDTPHESMAVSSKQLAAAIRQYHELHPLKDVIRLAYIGAGTAERLREAVQEVISEPRERGVLGLTSKRLRVDIELLDVADDRSMFDYSTGDAFGDYAEEEPDPEVLRRVTYAVRHLERDAFVDAPDHESGRFHVLFGSELFDRQGRTDAFHSPLPPTCRGLVLHTLRTLEFRDAPIFRLISALPPAPAEGIGLAHAMHRMAFAHQSLAAATAGRPSATVTEARGTVVELGNQESAALDRMHALSEWVYLMDANVDVEYFDHPAAQGRYVLDYVPGFLARGRSSRQHSYLITSEDEALIRHAINFFLRPAYLGADAPDTFNDAHRVVRDALNRLSGRQVFRLVGEPSWAKGAVGTAFAGLTYQRADLPRGDRVEIGDFSVILLIPIDDYASEWRSDASAAGFRVSGHHADLLALGVTRTEGKVVLEPLVIEVKNRRHAYSIGDLHSGPFIQLERTAKLIQVVLGLGSSEARADRDLKNVELAELIDYHLRRMTMQQWGADESTLRESQVFRRDVFHAVAEGKHVTRWPERSGFPFWGAVLHFNSADSNPATVGAIRELIGEGGFGAYIPFGLPDAQRLLEERSPENLAEISPCLDPRRPPPERRPGPGIPGAGGPQPPSRPAQAQSGASITPPRGQGPMSSLLERATEAFAGFVGNGPAKRRLIPWVARALHSDPPRLAENIAFTGPASTGKTELSRRVAQALGLPFVSVAGSALASLDDLLNRMEQQARDDGLHLETLGREGGLPVVKFPPVVVFIDEAHELRRGVQEQLLTLLEPTTRRAAGNSLVADVATATFVIATTDWGDLITTLQTRFQRVPLQAYSEEEVAEIVGRQFPQWDEETCRRLATAGRLIPRQALQRASEFANAVEVFAEEDADETLSFYYQLWEINDEGLSRLDLEYLRLLDESQGPVGLSRLSTRLGLGERELERNLEPFLLQLNLIEVSTQGRSLTPQGKTYLRSLPAS